MKGDGCRFYLGTHQPQWLNVSPIPLFVSRRRLTGRKTLPQALSPWALDSGGFTELQDFGAWTIAPEEYIDLVRRYRDEIGNLQWAAPMDWMCEPVVIRGGKVGPVVFAGTRLSVQEHQWRTVHNFLWLRDVAPELPWIPVIQGWEPDDYQRCADLYEMNGVDLASEPTVGVGTVCRRQHTEEAVTIFSQLAARGLRLHGFGLKVQGLQKCAQYLTSSDSMAWSYGARRKPPFCGSKTHKNCANCWIYAQMWRKRVVEIEGVV